MTEELVVLLDEGGRPRGSMPKALVHSSDTPLHLAFSCYVFDHSRRLLLTRRSLHKATWPGVWTNTCCGHPAPGEEPAEAASRRLAGELGLAVAAPSLRLALPDFRYRAEAPDGMVEHEVCPVFVAVTDEDPRPEPAEVMDWRWVDWQAVVSTARLAPWALSPWSALQIPQLAEAGVACPGGVPSAT